MNSGCHPETFLYSKKYTRHGVNRVGEGKNGQVFVGCTRKSCREMVAIKRSRLDMTDEYATLKRAYKADPKHIPKPYGLKQCGSNSGESLMYYQYIPSVTLVNYKKISKKMLYELLLTVYKLNKAGIRHGDLHLNNILIEKGTGRPYITDFGRASNNKNSKFDYHLLLNILYNRLKKSSSVRVFIGEMIPQRYLAQNSSRTRRFRLCNNSNHSGLPSLREVLVRLKFNISKYK